MVRMGAHAYAYQDLSLCGTYSVNGKLKVKLRTQPQDIVSATFVKVMK